MTFDFRNLARGTAISKVADPAALFDALPNKAEGYGYLRAVQKTILDAWSPRRNERDLVIKTNTGGGKTIIGLLILQSCLNEGVFPALYIAPDRHLVESVGDQARRLGIETVSEPLDSRFLSGAAICVTTMQVLFNGKSRFGLAKMGTKPPVRVGAVVIDDAHAALALTEEASYLRIPREHSAYVEMIDLFEADLKMQSLNAFLDIMDGDRSAVLRIPFWSWHDRQSQVLDKLRPHRKDEEFEWSWPLISDLLPICQAVVTADAIEILPPCPPIEKVPSFAEAKRRVYLTATLSDDSILVTYFDADPESIKTSIVPESAADLGDRLIIAPLELNPSLDDAEVRAAIETLAKDYNVVVLVPSHRQASLWKDAAQIVASKAAQISGAVDRLRAGHVGLVVIVNRYDGIDLPDSACRVLVIDGLPQAYSGIDRREALALRDSEAMITRQLQRLEQGMGRGVRSRDDRCAVVLLGPRLTQLVARTDVADRLSPATRAQIELSRRMATNLQGVDLDAIVSIIRQVVQGDAGFREVSREALFGITYGKASLSSSSVFLRSAYNSAASGRLEEARRQAENAVNIAVVEGDVRLAGWLGETLAMYLHPLNAAQAQGALSSAVERNAAVLRPVAGLSYKRIKASEIQAKAASDLMQAKYANGVELMLGIDAILADLVWDNERTKATEVALADIAAHLGIANQRPEQEYGRGSDVLWVTGEHAYVVIEAKSGATGEKIWKKDIDQLAGSVNWCFNEYGQGTSVTPLLMHQHNVVESAGTPPAGTRVLNIESLRQLKDAVRAYAVAIARNDEYQHVVEVGEQLQQHSLASTSLVSRYTVATTRERR